MNARAAFLTAFSNITGTGNFHSAGSTPFFLPRLCVKALGEISFPLTTGQAKELIALAEAAPFGKGTRTVLDEKVRKCWQIDAACFSFESPEWVKFLQKTVDDLGGALGIKGTVSAVPYKLLIYGKGGHFKPHKDTEKLDAMFGSLIIALPSAHQGGRLFIRHDGAEAVVDFSAPERCHEFQHAAFFADCEHEVEPVRSGYRFCVAYNLRLEKGDPALLNLPLTAQSKGLLPALDDLKKDRQGQLSAILLEHSYTEANLSLHHLKGHDQARALTLLAAAPRAGFTTHLALVTFHQMGALDNYDGEYGYRGRGRYQDPEEGTMGEIYEESLTISDWRDNQDQKVDLGNYQIDKESLISADAIDADDPDEMQAEGYTGNAGCTMDHWYRRAAIVLWAGDESEQILCRQNMRGACSGLEKLASGKDTKAGSPFYRLAAAAISLYPEKLPRLSEYSVSSDFSADPLRLILAALAKTKSGELLGKLLKKLPPAAFLICDRPLWEQMFKAFGAEPFDDTCQRLLREDVKISRIPLFQILGVLVNSKDSPRVQQIAPHLAKTAPEQPPGYLPGRRSGQDDLRFTEVRTLLEASAFITNRTHLKAVQEFLQADRSLTWIREVLGPVLLDKTTARHLKATPSLRPAVLDFATGLLSKETQRPLPPYPNWTRPCPPATPRHYPSYSKKGDPIQELAAFMADPAENMHQFARIQGERSSLESFIRNHRLDLDCITVSTRSPHVLVCSKNSNSHQAALTLRTKDETLLIGLSE